MIKISQEDYSFMVCCTVRYCLGSQSYAPSWIQSIIRKYGITDKTRLNILADIDRAEKEDNLGSWIDIKGWLELQEHLSEVIDNAEGTRGKAQETSKKERLEG